ncbi:MAG TPA: ATP-binding protein, partial [Bradyrhizobium sp.]|nr:ATP-binding protein [Bradyrhizobium sp.]
MITEVSCENLPTSDIYIASASVDLLGEILGGPVRPKFQRGVTNYPTIGDTVDLITNQELRTVYAPTGSDQINVGTLQQDQSVIAYVDVEEMLSKHFAVLGSTGVGKSSGVSLLLNEILRARPNLRIFLLDVHNEYGRCFGDRSLVLNPRNLKLPFWLFNFEEIVDVLFAGRPGVPEELDILAEVIPMAKGIYTQYQNADRVGLKRIDPKSIGYTADTPVPYRLVDLISLIDERMGKLENRSSRIIYHKLISRIETVRNDPRYAFMFDNANVGGDTMAEVISHLFRLPANGRPMTVMQLAGFPAEVIPVAKGIYTQYQNADRLGLKRVDPKTIGYTVDTPVPYRLVDLISLVDERMGKLENRSSRIIYHKLISRIETVRNDPRYTFMFDNANVGGDTMAEVISYLFRLP